MSARELTPLNLHTSAVHVVALKRQHHVAKPFGGAQSFRCFRCHRDLPESQFQPVSSTARALYLHPLCFVCRQQTLARLDSHQLYSPSLHRFVSKMMNACRQSAKNRKLVMAIDDGDVLEMYIGQSGLCALSGVPMTFKPGRRGAPNRTAISVDRVRSDRNYTRDNCHLVCAVVNVMKNSMLTDEFAQWCARIALHVAGPAER